jgi:hypothetical protein
MRTKTELLLSFYDRTNSYKHLREEADCEVYRFKAYELLVTRRQLLTWNNLSYILKSEKNEEVMVFFEIRDREVIQAHYIRRKEMDAELAYYVFKAFLASYIQERYVIHPKAEM